MLRSLLSLASLLLLGGSAFGGEPPDRAATEVGPWNLAELRQVPAMRWVSQTGPVHSLLYAGEPFAGHETEVFAFYASPATLGQEPREAGERFPGVVLIHGGGGTAFAEWAWLWAKRGYAAIAMDLAGCRPRDPVYDAAGIPIANQASGRDTRSRLPNGGPDQGHPQKFDSIGGDVTDDWPYHAAASVIRGHSLLRSFPEVIADRTAVTGISWGGYTTCLVASLDDRFRAAVPVYGCGFLFEGESVQKPSIDRLGERREPWIQAYDPSSLLPRCRVPILFVNGTNDVHYPLDSYQKSFDAVPGFKQMRIEVQMRHSHPAGWAPQEIGWFIDAYCRDGQPLPVPGTVEIDGDTVRMPCTSAVPLESAQLHYTIDTGPRSRRTWKRLPARIQDQAVTASLPPAEANTWFLAVTDQRGAMVTSSVTIEPHDALEVDATANTSRLMPHQVFELAFQHRGEYRNPAWDVSIDVTFRSPTGQTVSVGGFFYGSSRPQLPTVLPGDGPGPARATWPCDPADLWKARYAPAEIGRWEYKYTFADPAGQTATGNGVFDVVEGPVKSRGFVRIHPENPYRFVFDDGSPFFPIGYQDGIFDNNANGSVMDVTVAEGPFRPDPEGKRPVPPPGAMFVRGPAMGPLNGDVTFGRAARAGFNFWRFSPNNFSIKVFADPADADRPTLDHVRWEQARMVDELLQMTRKYGLRNFYGIFGYTKVFNDQPQNQEGMDQVKRIIKYSVDRWGAYVDFWEFLNEQHADAAWYEAVIPYLESIDPYGHPIATSWERPELPGIQVNAPHWYENESELVSDRVTADRARKAKQFGKPVVYGEQGNYRGREDRSAEGVGGVWDPGSARRMRVRSWTALFHEVSFIFWETSYAKDGHVRNLWIGPEERQYVRALQDFSAMLDRDVRMVPVPLSGAAADRVRAYGLRSDRSAAVYLHHHACQECRESVGPNRASHHAWDHDRGHVRDLALSLEVPADSTAYWYRPADGAILDSFETEAGHRTVAVPPFSVDLALIVTAGDLPDSDGDGIANHRDADDDDDGVPDAQDAWPLEREEWADVDGDRIGDNLDADINADGIADDRDGDGTADCEVADWDGDRIPQSGAIPWDAFPHDPREWRDTDGDGIGDRADRDDDGDGYADSEEEQAGSDPRDPLSFPGGS